MLKKVFSIMSLLLTLALIACNHTESASQKLMDSYIAANWPHTIQISGIVGKNSTQKQASIWDFFKSFHLGGSVYADTTIQLGDTLYVSGYIDGNWSVFEVEGTGTDPIVRVVRFDGSATTGNQWISPLPSSFAVGNDTYIIVAQRIGSWNQSNCIFLLYKRNKPSPEDTIVSFTTTTDMDLTKVNQFIQPSNQMDSNGNPIYLSVSNNYPNGTLFFVPLAPNYDPTTRTLYFSANYWGVPGHVIGNTLDQSSPNYCQVCNDPQYSQVYKSILDQSGIFTTPVPMIKYGEQVAFEAYTRLYARGSKGYLTQALGGIDYDQGRGVIQIFEDDPTDDNRSPIPISLTTDSMNIMTGISEDGTSIYVSRMEGHNNYSELLLMYFNLIGPRNKIPTGDASFMPIWAGQMYNFSKSGGTWSTSPVKIDLAKKQPKSN